MHKLSVRDFLIITNDDVIIASINMTEEIKFEKCIREVLI